MLNKMEVHIILIFFVYFDTIFFSSRYNSYNLDHLDSVEFAKGAGHQNGLTLALRNNVDDYFFTTTDTVGYVIHIFYPSDFPDKLSGSLSEMIINLGTETLISIDATVIKPTEHLLYAPLEMVSFVSELYLY